MLRNTGVATAHVVAERLRALVEASPVHLEGLDIHVTISAGCASLGEMREPSASALLALADGRMYAAKEAGRDRVVSSRARAPDGGVPDSKQGASSPADGLPDADVTVDSARPGADDGARRCRGS